ncbi:D-methionine transport system ATP-binding protein [Lachnospiraceae bacterium KHCPX20]|nr:D-methionine transport system ATP-binding protein [Lachnospiraceae bacterium KHCPX20]
MEEYIKIQDLTKTFQTKNGSLPVLRGVDLSVNQGEIFGIIGFSGAGKSTLARCVNGLEKPDTGSIKVAGEEVTALSKKQMRQERRHIGMVFQNFNLFEAKTVYENIAYPLRIRHEKRAIIDEKVKEVAQLVGLSDKLSSYPGGLSGGQKQRVGIARALIGEPDVLISDEATSALDPQTTLQILDLLRDINEKKGITILMITHELDAIKYSCDRMAVLEDGKIIEEGPVVDIFQNPHSRTGELFTKVFFRFQNDEFQSGAGI